jgi:hypothetical protein
MNLRNKILNAVSSSNMSIRFVTIHPLAPEAWGCKEEAYCIHILTHKRAKPDADNYWECIESDEDTAKAVALATDIEALGKISDREFFSDANFYTRQVYVGDEV